MPPPPPSSSSSSPMLYRLYFLRLRQTATTTTTTLEIIIHIIFLSGGGFQRNVRDAIAAGSSPRRRRRQSFKWHLARIHERSIPERSADLTRASECGWEHGCARKKTGILSIQKNTYIMSAVCDDGGQPMMCGGVQFLCVCVGPWSSLCRFCVVSMRMRWAYEYNNHNVQVYIVYMYAKRVTLTVR